MKSNISRKGFTLIELLIVIAIIAILAVAFVPTLLGAPAKGRDSARIASLQNIQKALMFGSLESIQAPLTGCVNDGANTVAGGFKDLLTALGGTAPKDPSATNALPTDGAGAGAVTCTGQFYYKKAPSASYTFGLYAHVEIAKNANTTCSGAYAGTITAPVAATATTDLCYAILAQ